MENIDLTLNGFSAFRVGEPNYNHKSFFQSRVEIITNGKGRITGVTNPEKLLFAKVPSSAEGIQLLEIGVRAFSSCSHLRSISFSNNLEAIGEGAFSHCSSLETIDLPETVYEIGESAFAKSGLKSVVFPSEITEIPARCFEDCKNLRSITFFHNPKSLGSLCFSGCEHLESIDLGFVIDEIPDGCFMGSGLRSISLPHSIKRIGISSFSRCRQLTSIYYDGTAEDFRRIKFSMNWNKGIPDACRLFVKDKSGLWCDVFTSEKRDKAREENSQQSWQQNKQDSRKSEQKDSLNLYLAVLGLDHKPTMTELNSAYRQKARKFHPDVISGLNLDQEFLDFASKKFRELTEAYEFIKKRL